MNAQLEYESAIWVPVHLPFTQSYNMQATEISLLMDTFICVPQKEANRRLINLATLAFK